MRAILAGCNREILQQYGSSRVLLAFDYDGTLAPLVDDPGHAPMRPRTRTLLGKLCQRFRCAVISGRARRDVSRYLSSVRMFAVIGNHGMEPGADRGSARLAVQRWRGQLSSRLADHAGIRIEDKRLSLSIHYRRATQKRQAMAAIWDAVGELPSARLIGGKDVVNVLPEGAPHKGLALETLRRRAGCDTAIYVGDDQTDEDVFGYRPAWPLLGIRVGRSRETSAAYYLRDQREIDLLLRALLDCQSSTRPAMRGKHEQKAPVPRRREFRAA
jgi:trehalose 6-phosphate phosphatase